MSDDSARLQQAIKGLPGPVKVDVQPTKAKLCRDDPFLLLMKEVDSCERRLINRQ